MQNWTELSELWTGRTERSHLAPIPQTELNGSWSNQMGKLNWTELMQKHFELWTTRPSKFTNTSGPAQRHLCFEIRCKVGRYMLTQIFEQIATPFIPFQTYLKLRQSKIGIINFNRLHNKLQGNRKRESNSKCLHPSFLTAQWTVNRLCKQWTLTSQWTSELQPPQNSKHVCAVARWWALKSSENETENL